MSKSKKDTTSSTKQEPQVKDNNQNNSSNNGSTGEMVSLGGIWVNRSKSTGEMYLSGYLGNAQLYLFKNKKKTEDKQPDYYMMLANKPKPNTGDNSADAFEAEQSEKSDNDIPF